MVRLALEDTHPNLQSNEFPRTMWHREAPQNRCRTPTGPPFGTRVAPPAPERDGLSTWTQTIHPRSRGLARAPPGSAPPRVPAEEGLPNIATPPPLRRRGERTWRASEAGSPSDRQERLRHPLGIDTALADSPLNSY